MKGYIEILEVFAREVLDSRANPTVEVEVVVDLDGAQSMGRAAVPSEIGRASCRDRVSAVV